MNQTTLAFLLTIIAGLSTMIGTFPIFLKMKNNSLVISMALAFAAGVMITVSVMDLLPESFHQLSGTFHTFPIFLVALLFFSIGVLLSMGIDHFFPEQKQLEGKSSKKLYRIGMISALAIILHNLPEGIATFMATSSNTKLGITLAIAIALHNIPEGISISVPLYYATGSKKKAFFQTLLSGLSEPLGALLAFWFLSPFINEQVMGCLFASIAGIMMHISFYELLPTAFSYHVKKATKLAFLFGILFMMGSHFLF